MSAYRDPSRERLETYLTRVPPDQWGEVGTDAFPISHEEWLDFVASDDDLVAIDGQDDQWQLRSHPEGEPLRFENGAIRIDKDDSTTIEHMVAMAQRLGAFVIDENGQLYEELPGEIEGPVAAGSSSPHRVRVDTEEERLRKRQALVVIAVGFLVAAGLVAWIVLGEAAPGHYLGALAAFGLAAYATARYFTTVFFLERSGSETVVARRSTRSTADVTSRVVLDPGQLSTLELVWFPLEYAAVTLVEFHVRARDLPWLVLYATHDEARAKKALGRLSRKLLLAEHDRTSEGPVKDVPKQYQLTKEEMKGAGRGGQWIFPVLFAAFGAGFWFGGYVRVAIVFFVLVVLLLGGLLWNRRRRGIAEKYRQWLE